MAKLLLLFVICVGLLPVAVQAQENTEFIPGEVWKDTDGNPINAHGGGLLFCHIRQCGVGKYHERRNFRLFRQFQPQLFQCVKQLGVVRGELCCLRDWRFRFMGLLHQHGNRFAPVENLPRCRGQEHGLVLLLRPEIPFRFQMVEHGVGVASCTVLQQAIGADFVQPQLLHPLVPAAPQNVPQQIRAYVVAQGVVYPLYAGKNDLRFPGDVH